MAGRSSTAGSSPDSCSDATAFLTISSTWLRIICNSSHMTMNDSMRMTIFAHYLTDTQTARPAARRHWNWKAERGLHPARLRRTAPMLGLDHELQHVFYDVEIVE